MAGGSLATAVPLSVMVLGTDPETAVVLERVLHHDELALLTLADERSGLHQALLVDLIIVDCATWRRSAVDTIRWCRERWPTSTIMGIGLCTPAHAIRFMADGGDMAVCGPASQGLTKAFVHAAARRARVTNAQLRVAYGDIVYDREKGRVWCIGREVHLTRRELQLFDALFASAGVPVSTTALCTHVWGVAASRPTNHVAVYIRCLRRKLRASRTIVVKTVRKYGYVLAAR